MHDAITAYERMREEYLVRPATMPFEWYIARHLESGFVFSRPDVLLVCRPVVSTASVDLIRAADYHFAWEDSDCWCISMLCGNMAKAWDFMPWFLPLMCFERALDSNASLRFYATKALQRLTLRTTNFHIYTNASA